MVSRSNAPPPLPESPQYTAVPAGESSPQGSPNPDSESPDPYANLSGANLPSSSYLSPDQPDAALLGRPDSTVYPAPSIISRDSIGGTPSASASRASWGSGIALAAAAGGIAGAEGGRRPSVPRGQSNLAHASVGWNNAYDDRISTSDEDEEQGHVAPAAALSEKDQYPAGYPYAAKKSRKGLWIGLGVAALIVAAALGVGLGVGLTRNKSGTGIGTGSGSGNTGSSSTAKGTGTATATTSAPSATATTGGQGSLITLDDGSTMTYSNSFGGKWVWDAANPFNNEAQCNSWTPALNQNWTWGVDKVYGVNLGGWLNTEPFIVSSLYEKYANVSGQTAIDEYTLSQNMGNNLTAAMTEHYETFITERDFAEIASAGLNWVRIPLAHWAIETWEGEPYLEHVSWTYFLKAIKWARKYGIRINLDFHTAPGSQNGWNHSGHQGDVNFLASVMGLANAQRMLDYIRTLAQFISQPEYAPVVQMFGFINEPNGNGLGKAPIGSFYVEAYKIIREVTGIGEGNGPMLSMHDGFLGMTSWFGFMTGADRLALDQHSYMVFQDQPTGTLDQIAQMPCQLWAAATNTSSQSWGVNTAGEWSAASNDCGLWVNNVGAGSRYDGTYAGYTGPTPGSCAMWNDYTLWNATTKASVLHFTKGSMDALQNWFFWTWKIGNSTGTIAEVNPVWHYRLGLANGWIPKDPREAIGTCAQDGVSGPNFDGTYSSPYMTGGAGAGTIAAAQTSSYPWPPVSFTNVASASMNSIPQFTQTGTPITMPAMTFTAPGSSSTINAGTGWYKANGVSRQAYAAISGCAYPAEYSAGTAVSANACGAGLSQAVRRAAQPAATAPPS